MASFIDHQVRVDYFQITFQDCCFCVEFVRSKAHFEGVLLSPVPVLPKGGKLRESVDANSCMCKFPGPKHFREDEEAQPKQSTLKAKCIGEENHML